ncbi:hypothetical protein GQ464_001315 [Rhodocaloribacter litoris]|uniref:hypothetical protein n=1 Tax=Rhodocaloribacter litoris TaxID=2558931 RepID=UPI0014219DDD|nr:hypothetical protein [Rhodocaloribacter litoris]QXD15612.1 hypothetical protein GQ464_001315 [Rhodocaloribacter litoris]GIV61563.1 MAG: hypothetical protein KatS3mg044_0429 [Rhodothermaceae bacterium]
MGVRENPFLLSDPLHDRVVRILLAEGVVTREQVEHAWLRWLRRLRDGEEYPLWRELLNTPDVDQESIFEVVALTYAFRRIAISVMGTAVLIDKLHAHIEDEQWNRLIEHLVLPVVEQGERPDTLQRIYVATYDPTSRTVRELVAGLKLPRVELRYAPAAELIALITELFPHKKFLLGTAVL